MPKIALELKAHLENLTNLRPVGDDFRWYVKMKCSNCGETSDHWQYVTLEETHEIPNSRGSANYIQKCKLCSRQSSLDIMKESLGRYDYEKNDKWQPIVVFECRGIEPVDFDPRIGWAAEGAETNTRFKDINLSEKDWAEYDEKASEAVGVYELEHRFVRA